MAEQLNIKHAIQVAEREWRKQRNRPLADALTEAVEQHLAAAGVIDCEEPAHV